LGNDTSIDPMRLRPYKPRKVRCKGAKQRATGKTASPSRENAEVSRIGPERKWMPKREKMSKFIPRYEKGNARRNSRSAKNTG